MFIYNEIHGAAMRGSRLKKLLLGFIGLYVVALIGIFINLTWEGVGIDERTFLDTLLNSGSNQDSVNPFLSDERKPRRSYVRDQRMRDSVLRLEFNISQVPPDLDAIVIGGGVSGMAVAATLSKAGKKVLVLEQNEALGGGASTFTRNGVEFEVGTHFIGEVGERWSTFRTAMDQLTEGQLEFVPFDSIQDRVYIGDDLRTYEIHGGEEWAPKLKIQFPNEHQAVDKFMELVNEANNWRFSLLPAKMVPLWMVKLPLFPKIFSFLTNALERFRGQTIKDVVEGLTNDEDLREVLAFHWNVLAVAPAELPFTVHATTDLHFTKHKSYWPVGGPSEIPFNMVPVIGRSGGKAFVGASVEEVSFDGQRAAGVVVRHKGERHLIHAPHIISSVGLFETVGLIPREMAKYSELGDMSRSVSPGIAPVYLVLLLDGNKETLGLTSSTAWYFERSDLGRYFTEWMSQDVDVSVNQPVPSICIDSNSAKGPLWSSRRKSHIGKSTLLSMTPANWEWFKKFEHGHMDKANQSFSLPKYAKEREHIEKIKRAFARSMLEKILQIYPNIVGHIDHVEVLLPFWHKETLGKYNAGVYGLHHDVTRYDDPKLIARMRAETDIPGLYLTGQDSLMTGVTSNIVSGIASAGPVLGRNTMMDLWKFHRQANLEQDKRGVPNKIPMRFSKK